MRKSKLLRYKGYSAVVAYDPDDKILHGRVINTRAVISFIADRAASVHAEFKKSVDEYLAICKERGVKPEKGGASVVTVHFADANLQAEAAVSAASHGQSLASWLNETVERRLQAEKEATTA